MPGHLPCLRRERCNSGNAECVSEVGATPAIMRREALAHIHCMGSRSYVRPHVSAYVRTYVRTHVRTYVRTCVRDAREGLTAEAVRRRACT